ncbi:Esterase FE4 [Melipona quadrifasciata]|uniref:Carboxylic ester hydrolase n=1 Tax=Melipona quadrifasciata TaxID=166423 RepID=A0A0M8ZVA5_9HYME|nr:Esterase FE4 [Melipona quadrifasciata]
MRKPIVTVKQGKLEGAELKSALGLSYLAFRGIPFAAPPVGNLRFKILDIRYLTHHINHRFNCTLMNQDPQPPLSWTGVKDISKEQKYFAPQKDEFAPFGIIGDEDCLYLNVYTNSLNQSKPVMFWIHGGAFIVGNSSFCESRPDYLLAKDVVVVSANHRLGAFGFLNLGHRVAPGNFGLKDLIAALEWVKENIANFGGDPNNVTIFGASAGGALVHSLLASPRARGLFHKGILHSGTLYCPWTTRGMKNRTTYGFKLVSFLGKDTTDPVEAVEFLRTVPAKKIVEAQEFILSDIKAFTLVYGVDHDEVAENPVLPQPIEQLLENDANVPVIISYSEHEYIMFLKDKSERTIAEMNRTLYTHVNNLRSSMKLEDGEVEKLFEMVKDQYFGGKPDRVKRTAAPNYFCVFSYVGNEKTQTDRLVNRQISGASHVDDIAYLLYLPKCKIENPDPPAIGTKDRITLERMTRMWTNFAKTGDPTSVKDEYVNVTWKPATSKELCQLKIGDELQLLPLPQDILVAK